MLDTQEPAPCQGYTVAQIITLVSKSTGVPARDIIGPWQNARIVRARYLAVWVARQSTNKSFPQLGRIFDRDHSTLVKSMDRFEQLCKKDPELALLRNWLVQAVQNRVSQHA